MTDKKRKKDQMYENHPYGRHAVLKKLEPIKRYTGERVLIAGCGAGYRLFDLYHYGADLTAVDQSKNAIGFIRSQFEELDSEPPELIVKDLIDIDLPSNEFDYILCYGVLHHTIDPESILLNLKHTLKTTGELELLLYHSNSFFKSEQRVIEKLNNFFNFGDNLPKDFKQKIDWWDRYENPIWETYTKEEAEGLVKKAGFNVDDLWLSSTAFGPLPLLLLPPVISIPLERLFSGYKWHIRIEATI